MRAANALGAIRFFRRMKPVPETTSPLSYAAVIFDMDGLLVNTSAVWERPAQTLLASFGVEWTPQISELYRGMDARGVVTTLHRMFAPSCTLEACFAAYRTALLAAYDTSPIAPLPGADRLLQALSGKRPLALASGSPAQGIASVLARFGWTGHFTHIVSSEETATGAGKPAPDVFLAAAERLGVAPSKCLVIEDSLAGVQAAAAAGMACYAVPSAMASEIRTRATQVFASLDAIADTLPALC